MLIIWKIVNFAGFCDKSVRHRRSIVVSDATFTGACIPTDYVFFGYGGMFEL